jgi:hypothetical protein
VPSPGGFFNRLLAKNENVSKTKNVSVPAIGKRVLDIAENKGVQQILQFWAVTTMTWGWIAERLAMGTSGYTADCLHQTWLVRIIPSQATPD